MPEYVGRQIGNYRITRLLGEGGFAQVYLGEHMYLQTTAAIKVLMANLAESDLQAFLTEARVIARLRHPNVVRVLEFGIDNEHVPFLIMTYAPYGTLRQRHPKGTIVPVLATSDIRSKKGVADGVNRILYCSNFPLGRWR